MTTYSYTNNNRGLITGVSYTPPSGVASTPSVTYTYDAAGNRTSMTTAGGAGGSVTYHYDSLSRLSSENRTFLGLSGTYTLSYDTRGRNTAWEYDADGRFVSRNEPSPNGLTYHAGTLLLRRSGQLVRL